MSKLRQNDQDNFNFIDLFAGAGGLSEGFLQAGFRPVAHVEMNEFAAKTLETSVLNANTSNRDCT